MFSTRDTRFATYLVAETFPLLSITEQEYEGRTRCYFNFDLPEEEGKKLYANYLSGQATVEPNTYLTQYFALVSVVKQRAKGNSSDNN